MRLFAFPHEAVRTPDCRGLVLDTLPGVLGSSVITVAHLSPGGRLGKHAAHHRQLLAVVSGTAEVASGGGPLQVVKTGTLVLWEEGEVHQVWAVTDLVAVMVAGVGVFDFAGNFSEIALTGEVAEAKDPLPELVPTVTTAV